MLGDLLTSSQWQLHNLHTRDSHVFRNEGSSYSFIISASDVDIKLVLMVCLIFKKKLLSFIFSKIIISMNFMLRSVCTALYALHKNHNDCKKPNNKNVFDKP